MGSPRRNRLREKSRDDILQAAIRLIAARGLENVSYGAIAKEADVSRPLVYFYFPTLRSVLLHGVCRAFQTMHVRFAAAVQPGDDGAAQMEAIGRAYMLFLEECPELFQMIALHESKTSADDDAAVVEQIEMHRNALDVIKMDVLERGVRDGSIRRDVGDLACVGVSLWGFTHGIAQLLAMKADELRERRGLERDQIVETAFSFLRFGLRGKKS